MTLIDVIILGVVQGLTEFLPVSSSGHLILARLVFGISDANGTALDAFLHLGTLLAVLVFYWQTWMQMGRAVWRPASPELGDQRRLLGLLLLATIPAGLAGFFGEEMIGSSFRSRQAVAGGLLVTAAVLAASELISRRMVRVRLDGIRTGQAVAVGLAQMLALVPGVSRSGMTIAAGQAAGLARGAAVRFSFLLSAPIIAGAGLSNATEAFTGSAMAWWMLVVGLLMAFGSGFLAIRWLTSLVERISLFPFVSYLVIVSLLLFFV